MADTASGAGDNDRPLRRLQTCHIDDLLFFLTRTRGASDLYLSVGWPPVVRVSGKLLQAIFYEPVTAETSERLVHQILTDQQLLEFEIGKNLNFSYSARRIGEFRARVFDDKGEIAAAFHAIKQA